MFFAAHHALRVLAAILARACVLLAFSEYIFFNEGPVLSLLDQPSPLAFAEHLLVMIGFYCVSGVLLLVLEPHMTTWPRVLIAGAFVGWSIESVIVPVAYENIPFSYVWTSITWHALIDVALGWVLLRRALFGPRLGSALTAVFALGVLTTLWTTWAWGEVDLTATRFTTIIATITALLALGYGLDRAQPAPLHTGPVLFWSAIAINLALWTMIAIPYPVAAAGLALVALANTALLWRAARPPAILPPAPASPLRLALLLLVPVAALPPFWAVATTGTAPHISAVFLPLVAWGGLVVYAIAIWRALRPSPP